MVMPDSQQYLKTWILKTDYFQLWVHYKSDLRISSAEKIYMNYQK